MKNPNETPHEPPTEGLLSVRTLGILQAGVVVGLVVGALSFAAGQPIPAAALIGLSALGATVLGLHRVVERSHRRRRTASPPRGALLDEGLQRVEQAVTELTQHIEDTITTEAEPMT
ncbi:hypothetical protein K3N28_06095 [Glycomyces sp. TRM65418]|uniref:hypothetical protein n=1 Tax=Glycomyces sp. TRM65418 TaxID=2867006 RepID=UPI001CE51470|nr:hypothetical protein [Glycomyces sp. TRM65418]MCC3762640.1 hypothetical protein [Glycomyces sp. TRM65418]QZD56677.1 hypothetical protein K3N28_06055 [Glycomyces sp. TRM65418]